MMTLRIGKRNKECRGSRVEAFTLIELIIVMTLLAFVIAMAAPMLSKFFRGRSLDSEARRLLSLTRQGQSRAVTEGLPMTLWLDGVRRTYGLEAEASYEEQDTKAVEFNLDNELTMEIINVSTQGLTLSPQLPLTSTTANNPHQGLPAIRFLPDGSVDQTSPQALRVYDRNGAMLWLRQSRNRLNYEIQSQTNNVAS